MNGLTVYNGKKIQFSTKYPALLVDRTNDYGYRNYTVTFASNPALPTPPPQTAGGNVSNIYIPIMSIHHGLGYIPAFQTVTIGYGLPPAPYSGINMWNEDALLSYTVSGSGATNVNNTLMFRTDAQNLQIMLYRESMTDYNAPTYTVLNPPSLAGAQLNINIQIFAMGLNDIASIVL